MAETQRLFFALWPDQTTRTAIAQAARRQFGADGPAAERRYHLTLLFLGDVDAACRPLAEQAGDGVRAAPFELTLDRAGAFGKALWLGPSSAPAALAGLNEALRRRARAMQIPHDERPFAPHVTCVRGAPPAAAAGPFQPVRWPVSDFALVRSMPRDSAGYRVVRRFPLVKTGAPGAQPE